MKRNNYTLEEATKIRQSITDKWVKTLASFSDEEKERINRLKAKNGYSISKAEIEIVKTLNLDKECVQVNISIENGWLYDICVGNKIIEYNGDYWHCNPKLYEPTYYHKRLHMTAKEKWDKDIIKHEFAINKGYEILVIWEQDYKKEPENVIKECIEWLKE